MHASIYPNKIITKEIIVPPSKSHTLRAILFALFGEGKSIIHNYLKSPDSNNMIKAIVSFGATIKKFKNRLEIIGCGGKIKQPDDVIFCGNSGITFRFISAISALLSQHVVITGDYSIRNYRPITPLLKAIRDLDGFAVVCKKNKNAPIIIKTP